MARRGSRSRRRPRHSLLWYLAVIAGALFILGYLAQHAIAGLLVLLAIVAVVAVVIWHWWHGQQTQRIAARSLDELRLLSPTQFELFVAQLLRDLGYQQVKHTGGPGDLSVDILCRDGEGRLTAVQCKRYGPNHRVGSPEVQQFIGMITVHHHAERGMYVTTSGFTQPAINLARQHDVTLIDGVALTAQLRRTYGRANQTIAA